MHDDSITVDRSLSLHGPNAAYARELYERWMEDPGSIDSDTSALFATGYIPPADTVSQKTSVETTNVETIMRAVHLARLIREHGHVEANLNPLHKPAKVDPQLTLGYHGLTEADLTSLPPSVVGGPAAAGTTNALDAMNRLRQVYCGTIGYEDDHVQSPDQRNWLRDAFESGRYLRAVTNEDRSWLLERITEVDTFEQFLHKTQPFQGEKRFSIEGVDMLVPVLQSIVQGAALAGNREVVIGMAHRGRLNVLTHVLKKPYRQMLSEFIKGKKYLVPSTSGAGSGGYTGDVKYHKGYELRIETADHGSVPVTLVPNPSHLEFVNPVVLGRARAAQEHRDHQGKPSRDILAALSILIHGDAAFPGQGVVAESLNLSRVPGYRVGGTIHIIANNQVGFTTDPENSRSTLYSSDLAKGFEIPIVHVNGDDPDACLAMARMALDFRQKFGCDFLIDIIGYRRHGHNETDEPRYTQPKMYGVVDAHPRLRELYADQLTAKGAVTASDVEAMLTRVREELSDARQYAIEQAGGTVSTPVVADTPDVVVENVTFDRLQVLNDAITSTPEGFAVNDKQLRQVLKPRKAALSAEEPAINWAHAEALAYASILEDGTPIRLSGQDAQRGTFSQRMLVLHDIETGARCHLLRFVPTANASIAILNSPLSETAALGFEYGYSAHAKETLVLWEGQFGDFANGAQVIIDQFIVSGDAKWSQKSGLVMLLPHGYEGQGPEHSSGRVERFLQSAAGNNIRVANCTTPANYFHLLRRQATSLAVDPRPLIVMTPKSLLRHPKAVSNASDLTSGSFQPVLDDLRTGIDKTSIKRVVMSSGKVIVDLLASPLLEAGTTALIRLEEIHPFPVNDINRTLATYPNATEFVFVQEEPLNMGTAGYVCPRLKEILPSSLDFRVVSRPMEASPAEGSIDMHNAMQAHIVQSALS